MIRQYEIVLPQFKRGFHLITDEIIKAAGPFPDSGQMNIFLQHTSAGLAINENADPSVRADFESAFNHLAPENASYYTHTAEGSDDMPAHIKSAITGVSLTIPIKNERLALDIWQGIYLCEYRNHGGSRKLMVTIYF